MSDFYGTLADALTYHADRGNAAWSADGVTDPLRTAALIRASEALDGQYGSRFPGAKAGGRTQALEWPREGANDACALEAIPSDEIPVKIERAAYELALAELQSPGSSSPTFVAGKLFKRERIEGAVERERFSPADGVPIGVDALRPVLARVEDHLRCLLAEDAAGGGTFWLERA